MNKILLVDDEPDLLDVISMYLENFGYDVTVASSGNEAHDLWKRSSHDLVISDIRMPNGTGIDLLKKIRSLDLTVPVILMTGYYANIEETEGLGVHSILKKPLTLRDLKDVVDKVFNPSPTLPL